MLNRRNVLLSVGAGAVATGLAASATITAQPAAAAERISSDLAAAIEAHRATIRRDEALYGDDCKPVVDAETIEASDAEIAEAFAALVAVPCLTIEDAAHKARYVLAGSVGLRDHGWAEEFLSLLVPDGADWTAPTTPMTIFIRSLVPTDATA